MKNWYKSLEGRFSVFPIEEQVLHVASDLFRAISLETQNPENSRSQLLGALVLIGYMVDDPKWMPRLGELLRLREAVASLLASEKPYGTMTQILEAALLLDAGAYKMGRATIGR